MQVKIASLITLAAFISVAPAASPSSSTIDSTVVIASSTADSSTTASTGTTSDFSVITPITSTTDSAASSAPTVSYVSDDPDELFWSGFQDTVPVPERGTTGASIPGPQNIPLNRQARLPGAAEHEQWFRVS
ncbi:unnamed protein product [Rhizoctonia solani]|uniref:Uncharacterized protein n=1 Tax=Rhizoctonia solani TaxID=456999 RepID=A0A8H3BWJ8_9AGAM|nr:unnamed protein product [Rhizoctonia solani]